MPRKPKPTIYDLDEIEAALTPKVRASARKATLAHRKFYGDTTEDGLYDPTSLRVFVGGCYHSITDFPNFSRYAIEYRDRGFINYHKITAIRHNRTYDTYNVQLSCLPGDRWFYLPKRWTKLFNFEVGHDVKLEKVQKIIWTQFSYALDKMIKRRKKEDV